MGHRGYSQDLVMTLYHLKAPNQRPTAALLCVGLAEMGYVIQFATYFVIFKYLNTYDNFVNQQYNMYSKHESIKMYFADAINFLSLRYDKNVGIIDG